uniref:DUF4283 domain-containing protein n=1 Tax=Tanacetum cinerariifolium TaxID=118510 RepID=A0A6L2NXJ3_TANCI|nr:hypothetical protein [Tanacetum cinerariifolium]
MECGFLSQKGNGEGRGIKEKNRIVAAKDVVSASVINEPVVKEEQSSLVDTSIPNVEKTGLNSYPPLPTQGSTLAGNIPGMSSYANVTGNIPGMSSYANVTGKSSRTKINFRTLFTPGGNGIDVVVMDESIKSKRFANTAYGFFVGKRVAYHVVANYVRNTWVKYGLVRSMFRSSTGFFSFQFSSIDGLDVILANGLWFIRNNLLILKKWHPYEKLLKEDGRSSYARAMIELRADVELKYNIMAAMPKITGSSFWNVNSSNPSTTLVIEKIDKIEKLNVDGKVIVVDDEGKPLDKVAYSGDYDSQDEVSLFDNEMASFLAKNDGYGRYGVSVPALTKEQKGNKLNTPYPVKANTPYWLMMDDPSITMEEYIKLQAKKAQRRDYPAIVYNDALTSNENVSSEPTISIYDAIKTNFDFSISFSDFEDEDYTFLCNKDSFSCKLLLVNDLKLKPEFILEFFSICSMTNTELRFDEADTQCFQLGGAGHTMIWRQFILALGLHTAEEMTIDGFEAYWLGSMRVAPGLDWQPAIMAGALEDVEGALAEDEGAQAIPTPTVNSLLLMLDRSEVRYTRYSDSQIPYQREARLGIRGILIPRYPTKEGECPKNIGLGVAKNLKKPSQTSRGVLVGPKVGFKPHKEYRHVPKKPTASPCGNKKKGVAHTKGSTTNTPIIDKIEKFEDLLIEGQDILMDEAGNPLKKVECLGDYDSEDEFASVDNDIAHSLTSERVGFGTQILLEQWMDSYRKVDYDDDQYDDDM